MVTSVISAIVARAVAWLSAVIAFVTNMFDCGCSHQTEDAMIPSQREQLYVFAKNFLLNPRQVASIVPSSRFLTNKLLAPVKWDQCRVIVEYGPGVGNISIEILKRMRPDAKLILIELNDGLAEFLQTKFRDPRVIACHRSAEDVLDILKEHNVDHADYVVSGIPFSAIPPSVADDVVSATWRALRPGGQFLIYQFRLAVLDYLKKSFTKFETAYQPLNFPPLHVIYADRT